MRLEAHQPVGQRVIALVDQQLQPQEFDRRLAHLARALDEKVVVHPQLRAGVGSVIQPVRAAMRLVLGDLVRVMDLAVVDAAGVDVEREAQHLSAHHRAFEVPAGRAPAPWRIPFHLALLARRGLAPDRNVGGIALALDIPSGAVSGMIVHPSSATSLTGTEQIADAVTTGATTGVRSGGANVPIRANFIVSVGATAGQVQLLFRSEVSASAVTLKAGLTAMGRRII